MSKKKKKKKMMKIINIERENIHIFWTIWGNSMKFSGKTWLKILLKVTKNRASHFVWKTHFWKNPRQISPPPLPPLSFFSGLNLSLFFWNSPFKILAAFCFFFVFIDFEVRLLLWLSNCPNTLFVADTDIYW